MAFTVGSQWFMQRGSALDATIEVDSVTGDSFTARYVGSNDPSTFRGEVYRREANILYMKQTNAGTSYNALHIGTLREPDIWTGYWCGVGRGNDEGEFKLSIR